MKLVISACLLGENCKYNGGTNAHDGVIAFAANHNVIAVCPEVAGGLPTPRRCSERRGDRVVMDDGTDVTEAFLRGAQTCLSSIGPNDPDLAILKAKSPSCGSGRIYDGTFTGTLAEGSGVFAELLAERGVPVVDEHHVPDTQPPRA